MRLALGLSLVGVSDDTPAASGPTDIALSAASLVEGSAQGTVIGTLSATGGSGAVTFSLVDSAGSRFQISDTSLQAGSVATDFESAASHQITVRATDGVGQTYDENFAITVTDVAEGPATITARYWQIEITADQSLEAGLGHIEFGQLGQAAHVPVSATASSEFSGSFVAGNAIDGNAGTLWVASGGTLPQTLTVDFGSPVAVNVVRIVNRSSSSYVTAFNINHSDNGADFTLGWAVSGADPSGYDTTSLDNALPYPYPEATVGGKPLWRLNVTATEGGGALSVTEIELRGSVGGADLTSPGDRIWHKTTGFGLPAANAIDDDTGTIYHSGQNNADVLGVEFSDSVDVAQLYILPRNGAPSQSPEDFTLQHSPDGVTWTTALTETGQTGWTSGVARTFDVP